MSNSPRSQARRLSPTSPTSYVESIRLKSHRRQPSYTRAVSAILTNIESGVEALNPIYMPTMMASAPPAPPTPPPVLIGHISSHTSLLGLEDPDGVMMATADVSAELHPISELSSPDQRLSRREQYEEGASPRRCPRCPRPRLLCLRARCRFVCRVAACLVIVSLAWVLPCALVSRAHHGVCFSALAIVQRHSNCMLDWSLPLTEERAAAALVCDVCDDGPATVHTPVFWAGLNGSACYRIPTIVRSHRGTLLAFAEARLDGCGDNNHHNLVLRRSSDEGRSWGPLIVVVPGLEPCAGCPAALSNPNPLAVRLDGGGDAVLLHYDTLNNPTPTVHGEAMQMWSHDDGFSWEPPSQVAYPPVPNIGALIGPSVGLQSTTKHTLFFSARQQGVGTFLYWSDALGNTWHASTLLSTAQHGLDECSIAWLHNASDGKVLMNCRTHRHQRAVVEWSAKGVPGAVRHTSVLDENCQGSMLRAGRAHFLSNIHARYERANLQIRRSLDGGVTWEVVRTVRRGPAAYSQLVELPRAARTSTRSSGGVRLGLLYEGGEWCPYEAIAFTSFEVDDHTSAATVTAPSGSPVSSLKAARRAERRHLSSY